MNPQIQRKFKLKNVFSFWKWISRRDTQDLVVRQKTVPSGEWDDDVNLLSTLKALSFISGWLISPLSLSFAHQLAVLFTLLLPYSILLPVISCFSHHPRYTFCIHPYHSVRQKKLVDKNERSRRRWDDDCSRSFYVQSNVTLHFHSHGFVSASIAMKGRRERDEERDDTWGAEISFLSYISERREGTTKYRT